MNVQGDEPLFEPKDLAALATAAARSSVDVATLAHPIATAEEAAKPSLVKVVLRADGTALYFSRAPIPFDRERGRAADGALGHVGIYAFRRERLLDYVRLPQSRLARLESLEQLRALEAGWTFAVLPACCMLPCVAVVLWPLTYVKRWPMRQPLKIARLKGLSKCIALVIDGMS